MTVDTDSITQLEILDFGNNVQYHNKPFPPKKHSPDREQSITKIIHVGQFEPFYDAQEIQEVRAQTNFFCEALMEELNQRGGTGIGEKFDLNYPLIVHVAKTPIDCDYTYHVYVEADYPRDTGSWVSQIKTRSAFNDALDTAIQKVKDDLYNKFEAKIVHTGMTGRFED